MPPYIVISDATLFEMSRDKPAVEEAHLRIIGVGQSNLARYGTDFLGAIANVRQKRNRW